MHLIKDENGNLIHHGHEHTHENQNETVAILTYMLEHNQHHAEELAQMAEELEKKGMAEAAQKIKDGVANFEKGNADLGDALNLVK